MTAGAPGDDATGCDACAQIRLKAELAAAAAERAYERQTEQAETAALVALEQARWDAEHALAKIFHETVAEVSKGSIDRSRDSAKYVQTAAAAAGVLYTGVLGLAFSVTDDPLPLRGVWAAMFLGLSIALATAYLAFLTKAAPPPMYGGGNSLADLQLRRTGFLTQWVLATVFHRRWAIRASVLALGFGVAFVPAPFVSAARTPDVPAAPVAPEIPGEVAEAVRDDAARLFRARVDDFERATKARAAALEAQSAAVAAAREDERRAERAFRGAAALALLTTLAGPWLLGGWLDRRRATPTNPANAAEAAPPPAAVATGTPG